MIDLPKSKYSDPIHTPGKEFTLNSKEYVGWYVVTYQDRYFTGRGITRDSKEIFPIASQSTSVDPNKVFVNQVVIPSDQDRIKGIWRRYLVQKINSLVIIEVSKIRFQSFENEPGIKRVELEWVIKGPVNDIKKGPYTYKGAKHRNEETVSKLESAIPGITNFFKDYAEFVE